MSSTLFTDAMALTPAGDGVYEGELNEHWTIGPKVHGGAMLALCANAARMEHSRGLGALPSQTGRALGVPPARRAGGRLGGAPERRRRTDRAVGQLPVGA
jgi:hypothetical protein